MEETRILLKLSGEALAGEKKTGFDEATVLEVAGQVKQVLDAGKQVAVVIGGGNFWRGRTSEHMDRVKADQIGILATVMNCIYVAEMFRLKGISTKIMTPFECGNMTELFRKDEAVKALEAGTVVFFAGGTGHPYFSTDMATVLMAIEIEADVILSGKAIDGESECKEIRQDGDAGYCRSEAGSDRSGISSSGNGEPYADETVWLKWRKQHCACHDRGIYRHIHSCIETRKT